MSGQFDKLLADIEGLSAESEALAKALPADDGKDDTKIQAAAEGEGGEDKDKDKDKDGCDDKPMAKSFKVKLEDGTEIEAEDGTELVKSLTARIEASEGTLAKALGGVMGLIKQQSEMIKSLGEQLKSQGTLLKSIGNEGRGRKAVVTVHDKKDAAEPLKKSEDGITATEFMAKANSAFENKRISGKDLTVIDVSLRTGLPVDPALIQKVMA